MQPIEAVSVTEVQALNKLREVLHKSSAEWSCPGQKRSVMAVLNGTADVVSIMATGSGKTMLVLLPVLLEPHLITVVIVPLKALLMDYSRRLDNFGISVFVKFDIELSIWLVLLWIGAMDRAGDNGKRLDLVQFSLHGEEP